MTILDPASGPRELGSGYKGDAWSVTEPAGLGGGAEPMLLLDTGLDSVGIVRLPDGWWDRSERPAGVHAHHRYDETILIPRGSGTLYHGPDPGHISASRFAGPVTLVLPAGTWHSITVDADVAADATAFFTVSGTVIEPFSVQMEIVTRGRIAFPGLPVVHRAPVEATQWLPPSASDAAASDGTTGNEEPTRTEAPARVARIIPYPPPRDGLTMPLDTGEDSLFIMAAAPDPTAPEPPPHPAEPIRLDLPDVVDVHRHPGVDEYIYRRGGAGYILNGRTPEEITLTPFRGPCLLVMPAGAFHRIVQTEEDQVGGGFLIYADRRAAVERCETIMATTRFAALEAFVETTA